MPKPANQRICLSDNGEPWIRGFRCAKCGAVAAEETLACRRCNSRASLQPYRAADSGKLVTWSVVERSFPSIEVPFVSAIVDLDDGLTLKGTLRDCKPGDLSAGMRVELVFNDAGGFVDDKGATYVGYHFVPARVMEGMGDE